MTTIKVTHRAGDADRDKTIARLRNAHAEGYISEQEFTERIVDAMAAETRVQLCKLEQDIDRVPGLVSVKYPAIPPEHPELLALREKVRRHRASIYYMFLLWLAMLLPYVLLFRRH